jgi:hypothetical protein
MYSELQKTKFPQNQWTLKEVGNWSKQNFSREEIQMDKKNTQKNAHHLWP